MSRIRSQLEAMRRSGQENEAADSRQPSPGGSADLERLRRRIEQLSGTIGALAETKGRREAMPAPETLHAEAQAVHPGGADPAELAREISSLKAALAAQAQLLSSNDIRGDLERIADGIASLQQQGLGSFDPAGLQEEFGQLRGAIGNLARSHEAIDPEELLRSIEEGYARISGRLETVAEKLAREQGEEADRLDALSHELNLLRGFVEELPQRLSPAAMDERLDAIAATFDSLAGNARSLSEANLAAINERFEEMARAIVAMSVAPAVNPDTLERLEARVSAVAHGIEEIRRSQAEPAVVTAPTVSAQELDHIAAHLADISARLDGMAARPSESGGIENSSLLVERIDALSARLETLSASTMPLDTVERRRLRGMEDQLNAIMARLDAPHPASVSDERLVALGEALEAIAYRLQTVAAPTIDIAPLAERLDSIEEQVSITRDMALDAASQAAERAVQMASQMAGNFNGEFAQSASALDLAPLADRLDSIENHLVALQRMADNPPANEAYAASASAVDLSPLLDRLDSIEQHFMTMRDLSAATAGGMRDDGLPPELISELASELQNLELQAREIAERNENGFDSIRRMLEILVDRIESLESGMQESALRTEETAVVAASAASKRPAPVQTASGAVETTARETPLDFADDLQHEARQEAPEFEVPSVADPVPWDAVPGVVSEPAAPARQSAIDADVDDKPMEPGSGIPDLAALVRDASKRRRAAQQVPEGNSGSQDFLAAARRAAQAAAVEAAANSQQAPEEKPVRGKFSLRMPPLSANRRKMLMGAAAVVIFAAAAMPIVSRLTSGGPADVPLPAEQSSAVTAPAETSTASEAAATGANAPQVNVAEAPKPEAQAQSSAPAPAATAAADQQVPEGAARNANAIAAAQPAPEAAAPQQPAQAELEPVPLPETPVGLANAALREAANAGDAEALFEIGRRYTDGEGVERDLAMAAKWYEAAARAGFAPAQYRFANFLEKGNGVPLDVEKAALWYERAAEQGNALAMHNLAVIHTSGLIGGKPEMETAIAWFGKAADLGVRDSQVNLGIIFAKGIGTETDLVAAYKWLAVAARAGDTDAASKRDMIAGAMRPDQLEKARGEAEIWKPAPLVQSANQPAPKPEWKDGTEQKASAAPVIANSPEATRQMIARAQALLAEMGYDPGPADGEMGERTRQAVIEFQKKSGLPANGEITADLLNKLSEDRV
jgi:localization factor PodJL